MADLEQQLLELAARLEWPATPQLAGRVAARLSAPRRRWSANRWVMAAAVLVVAVGVLLAYGPSRDVIAGWLNLHTLIERVQHQPTPSPRPPGPLGTRLGLGKRRGDS